MDILDGEIITLWRSLHTNKVKYIMVGGFATNLHGFSRTTADLDIWVERRCGKPVPTAVISDIPVKFLHLNHLIQSKENSNRAKDQIDLIELKKLKSQEGFKESD